MTVRKSNINATIEYLKQVKKTSIASACAELSVLLGVSEKKVKEYIIALNKAGYVECYIGMVEWKGKKGGRSNGADGV